MNAYPDVQFRHLVSSSRELDTGLVPILADGEKIKDMYDVGFQDAKSVVESKDSFAEYKKMIDDYEFFVHREGFE